MKLHKHGDGCYRTGNFGGYVGEVKRSPHHDGWSAKIIREETGEIVRFGGIRHEMVGFSEKDNEVHEVGNACVDCVQLIVNGEWPDY